MRLLRVRFTVRWMMIATAIVGVASGGWTNFWRYWELSQKYRLKADSAASGAHAHLAMASSWDSLAARKKVDPASNKFSLKLMQDQAAMNRKWYEYERAQVIKYERAACYPWLPVEPDHPPEPE
jgi:hypothetical protein